MREGKAILLSQRNPVHFSLTFAVIFRLHNTECQEYELKSEASVTCESIIN